MFTGLVEAMGTLVRRSMRGREAELVIESPFPDLVLGESIAVDGVCLTVTSFEGGTFHLDASSETLEKTTLGKLAPKQRVNLERALPVGGRLGGHIVSGHVDGVGTIAEQKPSGGALEVTFRAPAELMRFIAEKGSICVSGVSLTVNHVKNDTFDVMLIPHTREKTSLDGLTVGAPVNLEVDLLARYVARLVEAGGQPGLEQKLRAAGYM